MAFLCTYCGDSSFATKGQQNSHARECSARMSKNITVPGSTAAVTVKRYYVGDILYWKCQCNSAHCQRNFTTTQALVRHMTKNKGIWVDADENVRLSL